MFSDFVVAHDGFTLRDLVSDNSKHNDANGEGNRDGESHNRSWNCGAEGETDSPEVLAPRARCLGETWAFAIDTAAPDVTDRPPVATGHGRASGFRAGHLVRDRQEQLITVATFRALVPLPLPATTKVPAPGGCRDLGRSPIRRPLACFPAPGAGQPGGRPVVRRRR